MKLKYSFSKHALKILSSVAQVEALLSEDVAHQVILGQDCEPDREIRVRVRLGLGEEQILVYLHNTSKHKVYKYLFFLLMLLHKISNVVFCESSITCEPRQLSVQPLK